ncbi:hypothetical protein P8452_32129 [Trifolium repens]|nr:hypothetical protein P8452_32129 [Trifolium repens]
MRYQSSKSEKDEKNPRYRLTSPPFSCLHILRSSSHHCVFFSKSNVTTHPSGVSEDSAYIEKLYQHGSFCHVYVD